jgi:hypothetical protein
MALATEQQQVLEEFFSFYVPASNPGLLVECGALADAVTVKGPAGPSTARRLREQGWEGSVLFDRTGYDPRVAPIDSAKWFDDQDEVGARRLLTTGTWVSWDPTGDALKRAVEVEATRIAARPGASSLLAIDHRWLTRASIDLVHLLRELDGPIALVLGHQADPLGVTNAVQGLRLVAARVPDLSVLRTDHGGLGAIVFGARHASIGLIPTYRHYVPVGKQGGGKPDDRSARVFVREMLDWFTALTIAGWGAVSWDLRCHLQCCQGQRIDRFFDPRREGEAASHNRIALNELAADILDAPREDRRRYFAEICRKAVEHYGTMGKLSMVTEPKAQLVQWAFA